MKIQSLIAASAFVTATVGCVGAQQVTNPCNACPNGITSTMEVEFDGTTMTCTDVISTASYFESGSMECTVYEALCCPTMAANPCSFCPDGITSTGEIDVMGVSMTCSDFAPMIGAFEAGSDECTLFGADELFCCPPKAENPCTLCPNGVLTDGEIDVEGVVMTCSDFASAVMGYEAGSDECTTGLEELDVESCCETITTAPTDPTMAANPCSFCPDGITFTGEIDATGVTCSDLAPYVGGFEAGSDECTIAGANEFFCCPPKAENPCTLCPNGVVTDGEIDVMDGLVAVKCSAVASMVMGFETDSIQCTTNLELLDVESCCSIPDETITTAPTDVADTATTTVISVEETSTSTIATPSPEGTEGTSGGIAPSSPFGGFAFLAVASALWTVL